MREAPPPDALVFTLPRITRWMKVLSLYTAASWLVLAVLPYLSPHLANAIVRPLILVPDRVIPGLQLWRCFTYPLVQPSGWWFVGTIAILWWCGSPIEQRGGGSRLLQIGVAGALGGALFALIGSRLSPGLRDPVFGMGVVASAFFGAWGFLSKDQPMGLPGMRPVRGLYVTLAFVGFNVVSFVFEPSTPALASLGGMAGGAVCMWVLSLRSRDDDDVATGARRKRAVSGGRLRLVKGGADDDKHRWN